MKNKIADAWLSMAKSRSPDKITVQEIAGVCGISRQTFYKYFQDIIDVMRWSFEREIKKACETYRSIDDPDKAMEYFISRVIENSGITRRALGSKFHGQTRRIIESALRRTVEETLRERISGIAVKQSDIEIFSDFCTYGLMGLFLHYPEKTGIDTADFSRKINRLIDSAMTFFSPCLT